MIALKGVIQWQSSSHEFTGSTYLGPPLDVENLAEARGQRRDVSCVLTGFSATSLGEVRVVSFGMAQTAGYPLMIIAKRSPQIVLHERQLLAPRSRVPSQVDELAAPIVHPPQEDGFAPGYYSCTSAKHSGQGRLFAKRPYSGFA